MKREELRQLTQELMKMATPENQARMSEILTTLSDGFEEIFTTSETASETIATLTKNNETLRDVNAKLFLRVGETEKSNNTPTIPPVEETETPEKQPLTFEGLFNEKGELQ